MIAPLIVHALAVGAAAALAAHATERVTRGWSRPARWGWLGAVLATTLAPFLTRMAAGLAGSSSGAVDANPLRAYTLAAWEVTARETRGAGLEELLVVAWAMASFVLVGRLLLGAWLLRREARRWRRQEIDGVPVLVSPGTGPAVAGFWNPRIILPRWVADLEPAARALVVQHEREHCLARDTVPIYLATLLCALFPWNPALWWQTRRMRLAIEMDCDARVLRAGDRVEEYGQLLLTIAVRRGTGGMTLSPALTEPITFLERRIDAMTRIPARQPLMIVAATAATVLAIAVACSGPAPTDAPRGAAAAATREVKAPTPVTGPFFEFQVEEPVAPLPGNRPPRYPDMLRAAHVEGEVLAQFVVDTTGHAEMNSFKVLKSSHDLFARAVESALPGMRFRAAEVGGRKVKQLTQMPFKFDLTK